MTDKFTPTSMLVTGGAGFIGSNFINHFMAGNPECRVVNLDILTYAGNLKNLAAVEGKLVYLELKSGPPKHLMAAEVSAFLRRLRALRPHLSIFALDTALRLADKVLPMLTEAVGRAEPRRLRRDVWCVAPGLYAASARADLVENLCLAVADGLASLAPEPP